MGARPSSFKSGGGFFNGVDATITDYIFTDEFNGKPFEPGRIPGTTKQKFHSLYCVLSAQVDGADKAESTHLFVGDADKFDISEDGKTLIPTEDGYELGANSGFSTFLRSMVEAGFDETRFPEEDFNWEAMIGTRVRFLQKVNEELTQKKGKRVDKKTGKAYDYKDLTVSVVYDAAPAKAAAKAAPAAAAKKAAPAAKGKAKADDFDVDEAAKETLMAILDSAPDGTIPRDRLSMRALTLNAKKKDWTSANKDAVRSKVFDEDFLVALSEEGIISYDAGTSVVSKA